jgi:uncharacterized protein (DUF2267 family)
VQSAEPASARLLFGERLGPGKALLDIADRNIDLRASGLKWKGRLGEPRVPEAELRQKGATEMRFDEFVGEVQNRARLSSADDALRCTRATLETLGERLAGGQPESLGSQLPESLAEYLASGGRGERFSPQEFIARVSKRENVDGSRAAYHARVVFEVLREAVSPGEFNDLEAQLPDEYDPLLDSGSEGRMGTA